MTLPLFFWTFLGLAIAFWIGGLFVSARFRRVPREEPGAPLPRARISIMIPARDEEENLARLLPSIREQGFQPLEVIVVDDGSSDRTAEVAVDNGATVINGKGLPADWFGKPWALQQAAGVAKGDWFLFLDADTVLEPDALLLLGFLASNDDVVHSVAPYHKIRRPYEQLSAFFNVIMLLGTNAFTAKGENASRTGLFGQAMLISRSAFEIVGGYTKVRRTVLENFSLSSHLAEAGYVCRSYLGQGVISMRMFPDGYEQLVSSWGKGFISGADATPRSAMVGISFWLSGLIMSAISLTFLPLAGEAVRTAVGVLYAICAVQSFLLFRKAGTFSVLTALLFPIPLFFYQFVFFRALVRKKKGGPVQWKGRDVS